MSVGKRIKERRKQLKLSVDYIAEKLNVDRSTIYRYESSEIEKFPVQVIEPISEILNVSPSYLMGWTDTKENLVVKSEYPIFPAISAGLPIEIDGVLEDNIEKISIPDVLMGKWAGHSEIYITRTNGDSMNRIIPHGSLIAVKPIELHELKDNDIVVYRNGSEYAVKRFENHGEKLVFRPDSNNSSFTDDVVHLDNADDLRIKGKVVMWIVTKD